MLPVATNGVPGVGLKTYPRTLPLMDHEVVLTFDDGPLPPTTSLILDALRHECVRATFFLIGRNAAEHPELVRREIEEGHTVGHHTWSHPVVTLRGLTDSAARIEIEKGIAADEIAGWGQASLSAPRVPFFRFPGFADTKPLNEWLESRHILILGTDIWASDWAMKSPSARLSLVMRKLDAIGRGIILFHDTRAQTAAMIGQFLAQLRDNGYRVVHLVPGEVPTETVPAGPDWSSETEAILRRVMPRLLDRHGEAATVKGALGADAPPTVP